MTTGRPNKYTEQYAHGMKQKKATALYVLAHNPAFVNSKLEGGPKFDKSDTNVLKNRSNPWNTKSWKFKHIFSTQTRDQLFGTSYVNEALQMISGMFAMVDLETDEFKWGSMEVANRFSENVAIFKRKTMRWHYPKGFYFSDYRWTYYVKLLYNNELQVKQITEKEGYSNRDVIALVRSFHLLAHLISFQPVYDANNNIIDLLICGLMMQYNCIVEYRSTCEKAGVNMYDFDLAKNMYYDEEHNIMQRKPTYFGRPSELSDPLILSTLCSPKEGIILSVLDVNGNEERVKKVDLANVDVVTIPVNHARKIITLIQFDKKHKILQLWNNHILDMDLAKGVNAKKQDLSWVESSREHVEIVFERGLNDDEIDWLKRRMMTRYEITIFDLDKKQIVFK